MKIALKFNVLLLLLCLVSLGATYVVARRMLEASALSSVQENARIMMERGCLVEEFGQENFFWSSDQAIVEAERRGCKFCEQDAH